MILLNMPFLFRCTKHSLLSFHLSFHFCTMYTFLQVEMTDVLCAELVFILLLMDLFHLQNVKVTQAASAKGES